jgi:hypothetical protein
MTPDRFWDFWRDLSGKRGRFRDSGIVAIGGHRSSLGAEVVLTGERRSVAAALVATMFGDRRRLLLADKIDRSSLRYAGRELQCVPIC